jgi:hypothetical protein
MLEARMDDLFPYEREVRNAIQEQSGDLLGYAKRLLRFWLRDGNGDRRLVWGGVTCQELPSPVSTFSGHHRVAKPSLI